MVNQSLLVRIVSVCLATVPALAAADTFLLVPGVTGDAAEVNHSGWIRFADVDWSAEVLVAMVDGDDRAGRPRSNRLKLALPSGVWSAEFLGYRSDGQVVKSGVEWNVEANIVK